MVEMRGVIMVSYAVVIVVVAGFLFGFAAGKECTNIPTELSSHTFRYQLLTSANESWREEVLGQRQGHLTHTDEETWADLLPRKVLSKNDGLYNWEMMYMLMKSPESEKFPTGVLKDVSLHNVRLLLKFILMSLTIMSSTETNHLNGNNIIFSLIR